MIEHPEDKPWYECATQLNEAGEWELQDILEQTHIAFGSGLKTTRLKALTEIRDRVTALIAQEAIG